MKRLIALSGICLLAIGVFSAYASVGLIPQWDGVKTTYVSCTYQCFDAVKNTATAGFDPGFLTSPGLKADCEQAHADLQKSNMPDLPYCNSAFGTL